MRVKGRGSSYVSSRDLNKCRHVRCLRKEKKWHQRKHLLGDSSSARRCGEG